MPIGQKIPYAESSTTEAESLQSVFKWPSDKKVILYFTNWGIYGRNYQVKNLPVDDITGINYAFYNLLPNSNGNHVPTSGDSWADTDNRLTTADKGLLPLDSWNTENPFYGNFGQIKKLQDAGKKFNNGLSIGGWSWSANFSPSMATELKRKDFVDAVISIFKKYNIFNRVDIDWEYISPGTESYGDPGNKSSPDDAKNFAAFLKLMREALNNNGMKHYEISACTTADPKKMDALPIKEMVQYLDTINIMTYDFADGKFGLAKSTHQTNVYKTDYTPFSIEEAVDKMIALGVPSNKIVIGAAYYSRGFGNTDGLNKPCSGGSPDKSWEDGIVDFKDLPRPGAKELYDEKAGAGYSYDPVKKILNSYDTVRSIQEKCKYINKRNLKGIIVWEASGDTQAALLTKTLKTGLYSSIPSTPIPSAPKPPVIAPPAVPKPPVIAPPAVPKPPTPVLANWSAVKTYAIGDRVIFETKIYICIRAHLALVNSKTPATDTVNWKNTGDTTGTVPQKTPEVSLCPYVSGKIKTLTITGKVNVEDIKFNI